jgi:hypothetical protein
VNVKDCAESNTVVGFVVRVVPYVFVVPASRKDVTGNVRDEGDCVSFRVTKFGYVLVAREFVSTNPIGVKVNNGVVCAVSVHVPPIGVTE